MKILSEMCLWTKKSPLNLKSDSNPDSGSGPKNHLGGGLRSFYEYFITGISLDKNVSIKLWKSPGSRLQRAFSSAEVCALPVLLSWI